MHPNDSQVILWSKWSGLTSWAGPHMQYSSFDHGGQSGGSHAQFTPRDETHLFGIRMGWWKADPSDYVIYEPFTVQYAAAQTIYYAEQLPN